MGKYSVLIKEEAGAETVIALKYGVPVCEWRCHSRRETYEAIDKAMEGNYEGGVRIITEEEEH